MRNITNQNSKHNKTFSLFLSRIPLKLLFYARFLLSAFNRQCWCWCWCWWCLCLMGEAKGSELNWNWVAPRSSKNGIIISRKRSKRSQTRIYSSYHIFSDYLLLMLRRSRWGDTLRCIYGHSFNSQLYANALNQKRDYSWKFTANDRTRSDALSSIWCVRAGAQNENRWCVWIWDLRYMSLRLFIFLSFLFSIPSAPTK